MIDAMKKEIFESGHIHRERGTRRALPEGSAREGASLSEFMHATARDQFLPLLGTDCRTINAQVAKLRSCASSNESTAAWNLTCPIRDRDTLKNAAAVQQLVSQDMA